MTVFVTVADLITALTSPNSANIRLVDTCFSLTDSDAGYKLYTEGHLSGAVHMDMEKDFSDMSLVSANCGRHPMPSKEKIASSISRAGLRPENHIYLYDNGASPFATRAWFVLMYAGFDNVFVVNGGFPAIKSAMVDNNSNVLKWDAEDVVVEPTGLGVGDLKWRDEVLTEFEVIKSAVQSNQSNQSPKTLLIDARAYVRFIGEKEPIDVIPGRLPTAHNFDWAKLFNGSYFTIDPNSNPVKEFMSVVDKCGEDKIYDKIIVHCGSGVTATPLMALLWDMGINTKKPISLYMNSYSEWIARGMKVQTGPVDYE